MTDRADEFDTTPHPRMLRGLQNQKWTIAGALSELVDNAFGEGRGRAREVCIEFDPRARRLTVFDNGQGMQAIGRLFQLGNTIGHSPRDIGQYGLGGTLALLWLGRVVSIWTLRDGLVSHAEVVWEDWIKAGEFPKVSNSWRTAGLENTPSRLYQAGHGTLISIDLPRERSKVPVDQIKRELARTYAPALRTGRRIRWLTLGKNAESETLSDPLVMPEDESRMVSFNLAFEVDGEHLWVEGAVGVIPDLPHDHSKVAIGFDTRVILRTRDCYSSSDGSRQYGGTGIAGYLDLGDGWQPYMSTTKDGINDGELWDRLMSVVFDRIEPLLQLVEEDRVAVVLKDLGLNLQAAVDGARNVDVQVAGKRQVGISWEGGVRHSHEPPSKNGKHNLEPLEIPGDETTITEPARTIIWLRERTEHDMQGVLCSAEIIRDDQIQVMVNRDHPAVQAALIQRPINRQALYILITQSIACAIIDKEGTLERLFKPSVVAQIRDREPGRQQEGFVARVLMDLVDQTEVDTAA